jgi:hypothetical protein
MTRSPTAEPRDAVAERDNLAGTVAERHDAHLGRTAPATLQYHQIAVVEGGCANPNENFPPTRLRIGARLQQDTVNAAEMIDTIGFHAISFDIRDPVLRDLPH